MAIETPQGTIYVDMGADTAAPDSTHRCNGSALPPEQVLWLAVIHQNLKEACGRLTPSSNVEKVAAHRQAVDWFKEGGSDFRVVCRLAGLDPDWVRRKVGADEMKVQKLNGTKPKIKRRRLLV